MTLADAATRIERGLAVRRQEWIPNCWIRKLPEYDNIELCIADEQGKVFSRSSWSPKVQDISATDYIVVEFV
jgi:hypothetical protein